MEQSEEFHCPKCRKRVISISENKYAMELAHHLENTQITPAKLQQLEDQNSQLLEELQKQKEEFEELEKSRERERNKLRESLDSEREQNSQLSNQLDQLENSHQNYKKKSETLIKDLEQQILKTKSSNEKQLYLLEQEKVKLIEMQTNEKIQADGAIDELQSKIQNMEKKLKVNNILQKNLEDMCKRTVNELHNRENEIMNVRAQIKKENQQVKEYGILDSLSRSVSSYLFSSEQNPNVDLVKNIDNFELREIRGNRKDGRVRKAVLRDSYSVVALKHVKFNKSILGDQSVLGTLGSFWRTKTDRDIEKEKVLRKEEQINAFREPMLLYKLNHEYLLPLKGIIQTHEVRLIFLSL